MPRAYIQAFPDTRGQRYERTLISETQASPLDTAGDIRGITGTIIQSGENGEVRTPTVRRYRYRLGWNVLTMEQAVDVEHAVELCGDGAGVCAFVEWEPTDEFEYPNNGFALWPGRWDGVAVPFAGPFHWWDFEPTSLSVVDGDGNPITTIFAADDDWAGAIPTFSIAAPAAALAAGDAAYVRGFNQPGVHQPRRIRVVTTEAGSYSREKSPVPDRWTVSVTLIEKETGIAPGYAR